MINRAQNTDGIYQKENDVCQRIITARINGHTFGQPPALA